MLFWMLDLLASLDQMILVFLVLFLSSYYLQPLYSFNGKNFMEKGKEPSEIFWI